MNNFSPNPIVVKDNGIPIRIIELALDLDDQDFSLEVLDQKRNLLKKYDVDESTLISLDKRYGDVFLVYKDRRGAVLTEESYNLAEDVQTRQRKSKDDNVMEQLKHLIKQTMDFPSGTPAEVASHTEALAKVTVDNNARTFITSKIRNVIVSSNLVPMEKVDDYVYSTFAELYGMGVLQELDDDESIGEIMVNASVFPRFKSDIYYIKGGVKYKYDKGFKNLEDLMQVFSRAVKFDKKELNSVENAIVEATRANKDRVNVIIPDASENYILNIRKFSNFVPNLEMMRKSGTVNDDIEKLIRALVKGKANIGIGGEMGTGKTSFINFMLTYTEKIERKVVIASVSETDVDRVLKGHDVVILNVNDEKNFTFNKLIRTSLRTTASRIIIPESRGGEFKQVYEANLKTKGNMFTAHALEDTAFLDMCVDMYLSSGDSKNESSEYIKNKLARSIDTIIIMRTVGNKIRIKSISEVLLDEKRNFSGLSVLYKWDFDPENPLDGKYVATGKKLSDSLKARLNENGVPMSELMNL